MPKWPMLVVTLVACSGDAPDLPPMLGDCPNCGAAPISGNGGGGVPEGGGFDAGGDVADFDAINTDELDIVDALSPIPGP